jgi:hypothetical protein
MWFKNGSSERIYLFRGKATKFRRMWEKKRKYISYLHKENKAK